MRRILLTYILLSVIGLLNIQAQVATNTLNQDGTMRDQYGNQIDPATQPDNLDSTHVDIQSLPPKLYMWTISETLGERTIIPADTASLNFQSTNLVEGMQGHYNYLGNLGAPRQSRLFFERRNDYPTIFIAPLSFFYFRPDQFKFTNSNVPFTNLTYYKSLPPSKVLMPAGFAANHPLLPFNTALQYGIVIAVLQSAGASSEVNLVKFSFVNLALSLGFLAWCLLAYKLMPDHPIAAAQETAADNHEVTLTKQKEIITYICFVVAVIGMILQSNIGDAGYAITGLAVAALLIFGIMDFNEIRNAISAPIILMSAGVIGIADALGSTGLTNLVGETVAGMLGDNVNPFVLIFVFCILTSVLATLTGSTIGTVYVFAPMAIATCMNLGLDPTAAAAAIVISGWCGHFLPIDGMPAMIMGAGDYKIGEFWKFTIPQYFIRLLALTAGAVLIFPMR